MSTSRTLIAAVTLVLVGPVSIPQMATPTDEPQQPAVRLELPGASITAENLEQLADARWALGRFELARLELPHVTIRMRSLGNCPTSDGGQIAGSLRITSAGDYVVTICGTRRTLLHELGHVWDNATLDDEMRQQYLELRGLESWSHDVWSQAGGEHLAETISWALDEQLFLPSRIPNHSAEELAEAYRLVTGSDAPILDRVPGLRIHPHEPVGDREILETTDLAPGETMG